MFRYLSDFDVTPCTQILLPRGPTEVALAAFELLTRREFSYLSRARSSAYAPGILPLLERDAGAGMPLRFYYDLGGGYRAGIPPYGPDLGFEPGLGELLVLRQIRRFDRRLRDVYSAGSHFTLVIDNVCALLVNDIDLLRTTEYCRGLRMLIQATNSQDLVDVLVESEHFRPESYRTSCGHSDRVEPTDQDVANVARFLGRPCSLQEARERMARYRIVSSESERHLSTLIDGVHMTQRATASTFGFRPFPGGDSRIQAGEVALTYGRRGRIVPRLITSRNAVDFEVTRVRMQDLLPAPLTQVPFAQSKPGHRP